jgi:hypothetical protein
MEQRETADESKRMFGFRGTTLLQQGAGGGGGGAMGNVMGGTENRLGGGTDSSSSFSSSSSSSSPPPGQAMPGDHLAVLRAYQEFDRLPGEERFKFARRRFLGKRLL